MEQLGKEHDQYRAFLVGSRQNPSSRGHQVAQELNEHDKVLDKTSDGGTSLNGLSKAAYHRNCRDTD